MGSPSGPCGVDFKKTELPTQRSESTPAKGVIKSIEKSPVQKKKTQIKTSQPNAVNSVKRTSTTKQQAVKNQVRKVQIVVDENFLDELSQDGGMSPATQRKLEEEIIGSV